MVQVGEQLGMSQSVISRIEAGRRDVTETELTRFAELYGVSPSQLRDAAMLRRITDTDIDRMGEVIEFVETVITQEESRPPPKLVRETILAIFRQEDDLFRKTAVSFDPSRYSELVAILLRNK